MGKRTTQTVMQIIKRSIVLLFILILSTHSVYSATKIEKQREAFQKAYKLAEDGNPEALIYEQELLSDYVLQSDLQAIYLKSTIKRQPNRIIKKFLKVYPDNATTNPLLRTWLDHLYATKQWQEYLNNFPTTNLADTSAGRQCEHILARIRSNINVDLNQEALPLWMIAKSQTDRCDDLFSLMQKRGFFTEERILQRMDLAMDRAQFSLTKYLNKQLNPETQKRIKPNIDRWQRMSASPESQLKNALSWNDNENTKKIVRYGIKKQARLDISIALELWPQLQKHYAFNDNDINSINNYLALRAAYQRHPEAINQYAKTIPSALSLREAEWRVRAHIWQENWQGVIQSIKLLPESSQGNTQWKYWLARAEMALGNIEKANNIYSEIAAKRDYFAFLAADKLNRAYQFNNQTLTPNSEILNTLRARKDLQRAYEWQVLNRLGYSRSEWRKTIDKLNAVEKAQAAHLAKEWNMPTNSIRSAILSSAKKDLSLLYPIEYSEYVTRYAKQKPLNTPWVMGLIRQESLFMPEVKSSANAYGLMQLLPATAKQTARRNKIKYSGYPHLISPRHNIRLGTAYLAQVANSLQSHPALASAAYNGGPHRVKKWLPEKTMAADIWVENIVFNETRNYVQKVLANKIIYAYLLDENHGKISDYLVDVRPKE